MHRRWILWFTILITPLSVTMDYYNCFVFGPFLHPDPPVPCSCVDLEEPANIFSHWPYLFKYHRFQNETEYARENVSCQTIKGRFYYRSTTSTKKNIPLDCTVCWGCSRRGRDVFAHRCPWVRFLWLSQRAGLSSPLLRSPGRENPRGVFAESLRELGMAPVATLSWGAFISMLA